MSDEKHEAQIALLGIGFESPGQMKLAHEAVAKAICTARNDALEEAKQAVIRFRNHQNKMPGEIPYERAVAAEDIADIIEELKSETSS